jgi:hypothetical protein
MHTSAPDSANPFAIPKPIPLLPPVTKATLPDKLKASKGMVPPWLIKISV